MIRILVIGCGPHATHFYLPALLKRVRTDPNLEIAGILDILPQKEFVTEELKMRNLPVKAHFVEAFSGGTISEEAETLLDALVRSGQVNAVIISTDPLNHKSYAKWAISRRLPILMDKPVTTRLDAVSNAAQAQGIEDDYRELLKKYLSLPAPRPPFVLCAHRRYHPGILEVRKLIRETATATGCPVTNVRALHADGQWRFPEEILTQKHHSYNQGHGKVSHSGFHFVDCLVEFWKEGLKSGKTADAVEVFSSFVRPEGLLKQLRREDYLKIFGNRYEQACPKTDAELTEAFGCCGEIDAEINFTLYSEGVAFSTASLGLLHNSYSQRSWLFPKRDLYKGNGRVKHEEHVVTLGPFMNIRVHSYQSKDNHDRCSEQDDVQPGGNNHFDILVFRNSAVIGGKPFEAFRLGDLDEARNFSRDTLFNTQIKEASLDEWLGAIRVPKPDSELKSPFTGHQMSVSLMSAIYRAYVNRILGKYPTEKIAWNVHE